MVHAEISRNRDALAALYEGTENKHFRLDSPGSQFLEARNLDEILDLAVEQRPEGKEGDDRDLLIGMGSNPESFRDGMRYLVIYTPGLLGITDTTQLTDDTELTPISKYQGAEVRFSAVVPEKISTDIATIVILDNPSADTLSERVWNDIKDNPPASMLITAYPGTPSAYRGALRDPDMLQKLHDRLETNSAPLTVGEVKELFWDDADFSVNLTIQ